MINREKQLVPVTSPIKGVNTVVNREGQPPDTCWNALNMVPFDRWGRKRVAQRPGLNDPFPGWTTGTGTFVQNLSTVNNIFYPGQSGTTIVSGITTTNHTALIPVNPQIPLTITLISTYNVSSGNFNNFGRVDVSLFGSVVGFGTLNATGVIGAGSNNVGDTIGGVTTQAASGGKIIYTATTTIHYNPNRSGAATSIITSIPGSMLTTTNVTTTDSPASMQITIATNNGAVSVVYQVVPGLAGPMGANAYNTYLVAVEGGYVYLNTPVVPPAKASNQATPPLLTTVPVAAARVFNEVFFVDGVNLAQLDIPTAAMVPYFATAGVTPNSNTAVTSQLINTLNQSGGVARLITVNPNGFLVGDVVTIAGVSTAGWNGSYAITSVLNPTNFFFNISAGTTTPATVTGNSTATGPFRLGNTSCCLACTWRGRLVLAGDSGSPQNFYMSRAGNAFDWNYGATDAQAAVAGNLSTSGSIGEPITALIPFSDDVMMIGCTHSIWLLQGDPAQNGTIVPISSNVGVVGANGWTKDSFDALYFLGTDGLYTVRPLWEQWQPPKLLTGMNLDQYFAALSTSHSLITLVWEEDAHYLHLFATPIDDVTVGTHLIWDTRNEGLWPQQYPLVAGPTASVLWYSDGNPVNRGVLLGGWDGEIRRLDQVALDDTGDTINATLTFGPFHPFPDAALLSAVTVNLGEILTSQVGDPPIAITDEVPSGTIDGSNQDFQLANTPVLIDTVYLFANGIALNQGPLGDYTVDSTGLIVFLFPPSLGTVLTANYSYQQAPASPANVLLTMATGADAYSVTENLVQPVADQPRVASIACTIDRRQKTMRQRMRGGWFSFTLSNQNQPDTYFSFESAVMEFQDAGRNRLRR